MNTNRPQKLRDSGSEHLSDELISTHVNDEATEEEKLAISQHLSECGDCATRLEDQLEIVMLLKALPAVPAPRSFALRAEVANPAIAWFRWMRLGTAFATLAFVALFAFNQAYVSMLSGQMPAMFEAPAAVSERAVSGGMAEEPASSDPQSTGVAKIVLESREVAKPSGPATAEMAAAKIEATGTSQSPVAGYEWVILAVAIMLSFSALGLWFLRIRR